MLMMPVVTVGPASAVLPLPEYVPCPVAEVGTPPVRLEPPASPPNFAPGERRVGGEALPQGWWCRLRHRRCRERLSATSG